MVFADIAPVVMDVGGGRWLIDDFFDSRQLGQIRIILLADTDQSVRQQALPEQAHLNSPSEHRLLGPAQ